MKNKFNIVLLLFLFATLIFWIVIFFIRYNSDEVSLNKTFFISQNSLVNTYSSSIPVDDTIKIFDEIVALTKEEYSIAFFNPKKEGGISWNKLSNEYKKAILISFLRLKIRDIGSLLQPEFLSGKPEAIEVALHAPHADRFVLIKDSDDMIIFSLAFYSDKSNQCIEFFEMDKNFISYIDADLDLSIRKLALPFNFDYKTQHRIKRNWSAYYSKETVNLFDEIYKNYANK